MSILGSITGIELTTEKANIQKILKDFENSLASYEEWAEGYISGIFLDTNQKFWVGDEVTTQDKDNNANVEVYAACSTSEDKITLIHTFETAKYIPIGNTPFVMEPVVDGALWGKNTIDTTPTIYDTLDASGKKEVSCVGGQEYRITFYPNISKAQIRAMYDSYKGIIDTLKKWLKEQWQHNFSEKWKAYDNASLSGKILIELKSAWDAILKTLVSMWDSVVKVFDIIAHPREYADKVFRFYEKIDWEVVYNAAKDGLEKALIIAQDKGLLFILISAVVAWFKMLPPQDIIAVKTQLVSEFLIGLLVGVILTAGAGLAVRISTKLMQKAKSRGEKLLLELADYLFELFQGGKLTGHSNTIKPAILQGEGKLKTSTTTLIKDAGKPTNKTNNSSVISRKNTDNSVLETENNSSSSNHNQQSKNPNDKNSEPAACTSTNGCPVSMVTGEELLTLTEGTLEGVIPFQWTRLYRTSAAELDTGLGYGWSHSLSHSLAFEHDKVIWTDHENRQTVLLLPTEQCPTCTNNLAGAAIYLGNKTNEYILAQTGEQAGFYHFIRTMTGAVLTAISDSYGNILYISRDSSGNIKRIHNDAGLGLYLHYQDHHITGIDYQQRTLTGADTTTWKTLQPLVSYTYNEQYQLIKATNAAGESEHYHYDELNVIQQRHLAGDAVFYWQWQGQGKNVRCIRHWANFDQMQTNYEWDDNGTVTVTHSDGSQLVYTHDKQAKLIKQIDADGGETLKDYDKNGNLVIERTPLGAETHYQYDDQNRLRTIFPAEGEPTQYSYSWGFLRKIICGQATWTYEYSPQGQITQQINPQGHTTHYSYTSTGKIKSIKYPDGSIHELIWNRLGQLIEEKLPQGGIRRYRYDALGRQILRQNERGQTTQMEYDVLGRIIKIIQPNGASQSYQYNAYGKVTRITDELGRSTRYDYVKYLHLISQKTNPDGSTVYYQYNNASLKLTDIINEQSEHYHLDYHPNGLISQETGFDGRVTRYQYDTAGNLTAKTDYDGEDNEYTTTYLRSPTGKLLQKTLPDGRTINYGYNEQGLLENIDDGNWPLHYEYNNAGNLTAEHQGWATICYQYGPLGILSQCTLPDGNIIDYQRVQGGELAKIHLNNQVLTKHTYSTGLETQRQQGSLYSHYDYDEQGRLKAHQINHHEQRLYTRQYQYSSNGNLTEINDSRRGIRHYYYDPLDRLIQVRGNINEDLIHDPAGNLLAQNQNPQYANVKGNRLLMQGDSHFSYDDFGNLIQEARGKGQKLISSYQYDCQHQLIKAERPDGMVVTYQYDAFGRRISKTVTDSAGKTTRTEFIWLGEKLLAESSQQHYQTYLYESGSFKPLALLKGRGKSTQVYYYQLDHLGTPQELTATNGQIVWSGQYRAYGNLALQDVYDIEQPLRFQGQYHDQETGLYYNRHRYYSSDTGRYITPDPIKLAGGLNSYQYCTNPMNWIDPLGLSSPCPPDSDNISTTPETKASVDAGEASPTKPPEKGYHNETYSPKPIKPEDATQNWEKFLGEEPHTNTHPRTGQPDPDRIVSADGKRSIRYGNHEMGSSPTKHHYHEEIWTYDPINNVMNVDSLVIRVPILPAKPSVKL